MNVMKKTITVAFMLIVATLGACKQQSNQENGPLSQRTEEKVNGPVIFYTENKHDFDTINTSEGGCYVFHYTNKGDAPLIISDVLTSCGCITKEWNKAPLNADESDSIVLHIRSKSLGRLQKAIVVKNNSVNESTTIIRLEGFVVE